MEHSSEAAVHTSTVSTLRGRKTPLFRLVWSARRGGIPGKDGKKYFREIIESSNIEQSLARQTDRHFPGTASETYMQLWTFPPTFPSNLRQKAANKSRYMNCKSQRWAAAMQLQFLTVRFVGIRVQSKKWLILLLDSDVSFDQTMSSI